MLGYVSLECSKMLLLTVTINRLSFYLSANGSQRTEPLINQTVSRYVHGVMRHFSQHCLEQKARGDVSLLAHSF